MFTRASHTEARSESHCRLTADAVVLAARPDGSVDLEFTPFPGCKGCAGTCLWKRLEAARLERMPAPDGLAPGTQVTVALPARRILAASMLVHGVPLAAILSGAAAGSFIAGSDIGALGGAVTAVILVMLGFGAVRRRVEQATLAGLVITQKS
jgi:positive regulator of sigma E activity